LDYPRKSGGLRGTTIKPNKAEGVGVCPRLAEARWSRLDFAKKLSNPRVDSLRVYKESVTKTALFVGGSFRVRENRQMMEKS
jgi:hypothetical protein